MIKLTVSKKGNFADQMNMNHSLLIALLVVHSGLTAGNKGIDSLMHSANGRVVGFIENKGQIYDQGYHPNPAVLYLLNRPGMNIQLRKTGFSYDTYVAKSIVRSPKSIVSGLKTQGHGLMTKDSLLTTYEFHRVDVDLSNANPDVQVKAEEPFSDYFNYYNSITGGQGVIGVHHYKKVTYQNIYNNIDLVFSIEKGKPEYDFIIHPGGKVQDIVMQYKGMDDLQQSGLAELSIEVKHGLSASLADRFTDAIPMSYERETNTKVNVAYCLKTCSDYPFRPFSDSERGLNQEVTFTATAYNPNHTLIIDPVPTLLWSTYYGGSGVDEGFGIAVDAGNNILVTGRTLTSGSAPNAIATAGCWQTTFGGGKDAFIGKFNSGGILQWGTYYGGGGDDVGWGITVAADSIYVTGNTFSTNAIATAGSWQTINDWGGSVAFVAKFNTNGTLLWGTYYGGGTSPSITYGHAIVVDAVGNVFATGYTMTGANGITAGCWQPTFGGGAYDAFIAKFNTNGTQLLWGTYYGGTGNDDGYGIAVDAAGNVYVTGDTPSPTTTAIASSGCWQAAFGGGDDAFLAEFNTNGVRQWGTYYGGTGSDAGYGIAVDADNTILVSGYTFSTNAIATAGSWQVTEADGGANDDVFVAKFNNSGTQLLWGTYYGGIGGDGSYGMALDAGGNVLVTGVTGSTNAIASSGAWQSAFGKGTEDAFVAKFNPGGTQLLWGTYYGGSGSQLGYAIAADACSNILVTGYTNSTNVIASSGAWQPVYGGGTQDAFVAKFAPFGVSISGSNSSGVICSGNSYTLTASGATNYTWNNGATGSVITLVPGLTTSYTVSGNIGTCSIVTATYTITVNPLPTITMSPSATVCSGQSVALSAFGGGSGNYTWQPSAYLSATTGATNTASPPAETYTFTVTGSGASGCSRMVSILVNATPTLQVTSPTTICSGSQPYLSVIGAGSYLWIPSATLNSPNVSIVTASPTVSTTYTVIGTGSGGCTSMLSTNIGVYVLPTLSVSPNATFCAGASTVLSASGSASLDYVWSPAAALNVSTGFVVTANPTISTTYTLAATDANACTNTMTVFVQVNATPVADAGFPQEICQGNPAALSASGGGSYVWSPADYLNSDTGANVMANPTVFGVYGYTVVVTGVNDCSAVGTVTVTVVSSLTANVGSDQSVCSGITAMLVGTGGAAYAWYPAMGLSTVTGNATVFSIPTPGVYSYTLTATSGSCSSTAGVTVTVLVLPTVVVSPGATVCLGNAAALTAGLLNVTTQTITWFPAAGLSSSVGQRIYAAPSVTTTYTVIGTDQNGCSNSTLANVTVTLNPLPVVSISPANIAICFGDSTILTASGITGQLPMSYLWIPPATLSSDTGAIVIASPTIITSYTVTGTDGNGCYSIASATVNVDSATVIIISPANSLSVCQGASIGLTVSGGSSYSWLPVYGLSNVTSATVTASPTLFITYVVTGANGSCVGKDSVRISIYTLPTVVASADVSVCSGGSAVLSATGAAVYNWSPATSPTAGAVVSASPVAATSYTVTGTDGNGCQSYDTVLVSVVNPIQVAVSPEVTIAAGSSTVVSASTGGRSYLWIPADFLSCNSCQSVIASPTATTVYTVTMIDNNGCSSSATVSVDVAFSCGTIFVPDVFSPNADNVNDVFFVYGAEHCIDPNSYTLQIFDRWGNRVFESFDPGQGWDGKYKGKELDEAVFIYSLQAILINGTSVSKKGNISLIK